MHKNKKFFLILIIFTFTCLSIGFYYFILSSNQTLSYQEPVDVFPDKTLVENMLSQGKLIGKYYSSASWNYLLSEKYGGFTVKVCSTHPCSWFRFLANKVDLPASSDGFSQITGKVDWQAQPHPYINITLVKNYQPDIQSASSSCELGFNNQKRDIFRRISEKTKFVFRDKFTPGIMEDSLLPFEIFQPDYSGRYMEVSSRPRGFTFEKYWIPIKFDSYDFSLACLYDIQTRQVIDLNGFLTPIRHFGD